MSQVIENEKQKQNNVVFKMQGLCFEGKFPRPEVVLLFRKEESSSYFKKRHQRGKLHIKVLSKTAQQPIQGNSYVMTILIAALTLRFSLIVTYRDLSNGYSMSFISDFSNSNIADIIFFVILCPAVILYFYTFSVWQCLFLCDSRILPIF